MDRAALLLKYENEINYLNFSPDFRSIWVGRHNGYQIFDFIDNLQDRVCQRVGEDTAVGNVRMICENPQGYNKLYGLEYSRTKVIGTNVKVIPRNKLTVPFGVHEMFYGEKVVVYVTVKGIYCYNINDGKLIEVSCKPQPFVTAFSETVFAFFEKRFGSLHGNVVIFDIDCIGAMKSFSSLKNVRVQHLALNKDGTLLAAVKVAKWSECGVDSVHVHNVQDGELLMSFDITCRGKILCMNFSLDNKYIFMSFENNICGFDLEPSGFHTFQHQVNCSKPVSHSLFGKLPETAFVSKICYTTVFSEPRVVVITSKGNIYYYKIDWISGIMNLVTQNTLTYLAFCLPSPPKDGSDDLLLRKF